MSNAKSVNASSTTLDDVYTAREHTVSCIHILSLQFFNVDCLCVWQNEKHGKYFKSIIIWMKIPRFNGSKPDCIGSNIASIVLLQLYMKKSSSYGFLKAS